MLTNRDTGEGLPVHPSSSVRPPRLQLLPLILLALATTCSLWIISSSQVATIASIKENVVIERPNWAYLLHRLPKLKKTFIAFVARDCLDAFNLQNR